jgi:hypothetical protein
MKTSTTVVAIVIADCRHSLTSMKKDIYAMIFLEYTFLG